VDPAVGRRPLATDVRVRILPVHVGFMGDKRAL